MTTKISNSLRIEYLPAYVGTPLRISSVVVNSIDSNGVIYGEVHTSVKCVGSFKYIPENYDADGKTPSFFRLSLSEYCSISSRVLLLGDVLQIRDALFVDIITYLIK